MSSSVAGGLQTIRGVYGAAQVVAPGLLAGRLLGLPEDRRTRAVARVLGARQLAQALVSAGRPSERTLAVGAGIDLLHAGSMVVLGLADPRRRRTAWTDALVAGGFGLAGCVVAGLRSSA